MSRRSLAVGGVSALAASALPAVSALAVGVTPATAPDGTPRFGPEFGPDAALLRQVAATDRCWRALVEAEAAFERLYHAMECQPGYPRDMPGTEAVRARRLAFHDRFGIGAAEAGCERLSDRYEAAAAAAFVMPARTLPGVVAKTRLAVAEANERHCGWDHEPCEGLDLALADLERLAAG